MLSLDPESETDMDLIRVLKCGAQLVLKPGAGTAVHVVEGSVWLTQHHDTRDYVMRAGEGMALKGVGKTLIHAFEDSSLRFSAPENTRTPMKIGFRLKDPIAVSG